MHSPLNTIILGDAIDSMKERLLPKSVHTIVTSPPYWGLRDYGLEPRHWPAMEYSIFGMTIQVPEMTCCLGLESTPQAFVGHMVLVFREAWRVLRDDGTLWLNLGDSYAGSGKAKGDKHMSKYKQGTNRALTTNNVGEIHSYYKSERIKPKDLIGIPWMVAYALRDEGWYLRQDIIWQKPNPMPESVFDRTTKAHEYIFLLSKRPNYYYDAEAIKTDTIDPEGDLRKYANQNWNNKSAPDEFRNGIRPRSSGNKQRKNGSERDCPEGTGSNVCSSVPRVGTKANKRSVWTVSTKAFAGAHFATFPPDLIVDCIKAGTSEHGCCAECGKPYERITTKELMPTNKASYNSNTDKRDMDADLQDQGSNRQKDGHKPGWAYKTETTGWQKMCKCEAEAIKPCVVFDMFSGSGTTAEVSGKLGRDWIAIEASPKYHKMSQERLHGSLGLFLKNTF